MVVLNRQKVAHFADIIKFVKFDDVSKISYFLSIKSSINTCHATQIILLMFGNSSISMKETIITSVF